MMLTVMAACQKERQTIGAIYTCDEFTVFPDSIDSDILIVAPRDSMIVTISNGRSTTRPMCKPVEGRLSLSGADTLLVDLFNRSMEELTAAADELQGNNRLLDVYLTLSLTDPARARNILMSNDSSLMTVDFMSTPVIVPDAIRDLAAGEVWLSTGDAVFLKKSVAEARKRLEVDREIAFDRNLYLFKGATPELTRHGAMPEWMTVADYAATISLTVNVGHAATLRFLAEANPADACTLESQRDSLVNAIDTYFWIPNLDCYSEALAGVPYPMQIEMTDNLAQTLAVVSGVTSRPMSVAMVSSMPVFDDLIPRYYPSSETTQDQATAAMTCIAASMVGNETVFSNALSTLVFHAYETGSGGTEFIGAILRGLAGISLSDEGMMFSPMVPTTMPGEKLLSALHYRDAILDIRISGSGNIISTFTIDGEVKEHPIVPRDLKGHHDVSITLVGLSNDRRDINFVKRREISAAPIVNWMSPRHAEINKGNDAATMLYLNGAFIDESDNDSYDLYQHAPVTAITFAGLSEDNRPGFPSQTYLYIPPADSISIDVANVAARTGAHTLKEKQLVKRHVESTRFKNAHIEFEVEVDSAGERLIQLVYLNGLGIVNPERHYATRLLSVNGSVAGLFVLPQLPPTAWRPNVDWRSHSGTSLPIKARLNKGTNRLSIDYYAPEIDRFNHDSNTLIPVKVIITTPRQQ